MQPVLFRLGIFNEDGDGDRRTGALSRILYHLPGLAFPEFSLIPRR